MADDITVTLTRKQAQLYLDERGHHENGADADHRALYAAVTDA